jgi:hypothetical protein
VTCREEVLKAATFLSRRSGCGTFALADLMAEMQRRGTNFAESTIRTHVTSRMCINAPANHASRSDDLERVGRGFYRLR